LEKQRVTSIDIFRGLTMMLMTIVNNPGDWGNVYTPLLHAEWHGATPTDMVFPFFVFIMGTAMPFSTNENSVIGSSNFLKIFTRSLRIFNLGLFLNFFSKIEIGDLGGTVLVIVRLVISVLVAYILLGNFKPKVKFYSALGLFVLMISLCFSGIEAYASVRIPGVLQRIGVVYFFAALIFLGFDFRQQMIAGAVLLLGYWAAMALIPIPGQVTGNYEIGTNLAAWLDNYLLPGHLWASSKTWDPEGILSTFPAIVTALLGIWAGKLLQSKESDSFKWLLGLGIGLVILAKVWDISFPINKALWTSSYVFFAGGCAMVVLALIQVLFKSEKPKFLTNFLIMWGVNPMIVFYGSGIIPRALNVIEIPNGEDGVALLQYFYDKLLVPIFANPMNSSLAYAISYVVFWSLILYFLDRKKLVFKV
jgi:predicted acyltransferase